MTFTAKTYERPYFLLCEGEGDKRFFDRVLSRLNMSGDFHVEFPDRAGDPTGGRSKFGRKLFTLVTTSPTFRANVRGVLIVSDNDENKSTSWQEVQKQLSESGFPMPHREGVAARKAGYPCVAVLMIPIGETGNLETLCLTAAYQKWSIQSAVEAFSCATPAATWPDGKQSKMKLQSVLAATCEARPEAGFLGHWREHEDYHIPLSHICFRPIEDYLRDFPSLVALS